MDGVFSIVTFSGLPALRTASVEYFPDGVDVVIGGLEATPGVLAGFPSDWRFEAGTVFSYPLGQGARPHFFLESADPDILSVSGPNLRAHKEGFTTLRIGIRQMDGSVEYVDREAAVAAAAASCPPYGLEAQLLDNGGQMDDFAGSSAAISGLTVLAGAPEADSGGLADAGKAIVWVRQAGLWMQQAVLTLTGSAAGDAAGRAEALEGDLAFVGAPGRAGGGVVEVFGRGPGGTWSPAAVLTPPAAQPGRQFGYALALAVRAICLALPLQWTALPWRLGLRETTIERRTAEPSTFGEAAAERWETCSLPMTVLLRG